VPTIRVFEALACGIPLASLAWDDIEGLFTPDEDYLVVRTRQEMNEALAALRDDANLAARLAEHGRRTILARHTCAHRVDELLDICRALGGESRSGSRQTSGHEEAISVQQSAGSD
jgi:spore maturation protein CgeB